MNKFKKGVAIVLVAATAMGFASCAKKSSSKENIEPTEPSKSVSQVTEAPEQYTVYVYSKPVFVAYVDFGAKIGEKVALAQNDELAKDAYSAILGEFEVKLTENTVVKPGQEVTVTGITYIDPNGNYKNSYKKGVTTNDLDIGYDEQGKPKGIAYQVSVDGKVVGYTSYTNDELKLVEDCTIETSNPEELQDELEPIESYVSDKPVFYNGEMDLGPSYVLK